MKSHGCAALVLSTVSACGASRGSTSEAAPKTHDTVDIALTSSSAVAQVATSSSTPPTAGSAQDPIEPSASDLFLLQALGDEQSDAVSSALGTPDPKPFPDGVTVGGAAVTGGSIANAASIVAGLRPCFETCFKNGLPANPKMRGSMKITAVIGAKGEVSSATPAGAGGLTHGLRDCAVACVSSAHFSPPASRASEVVVPVTFVAAQPLVKSSGASGLHLGGTTLP